MGVDMRTALFLAPLTLVLAVADANARPVPEVQRFLQEEITKLAAAGAPPVGGAGGTYGEYELALFRLRLRAELGFDVGAARVSVEPVAEFFWEQ
jgi:hypothetical protein